jgi:hypothetical protein
MNRLGGNFLRRMLNFQCPCGYHFKTFESNNDAIAKIKLHFERFHKDFLPFGLTNDEALTLLTKGKEETKLKISKRTAYSVQKEPALSIKNTASSLESLLNRLLGKDIEVERQPERKKAQLIA